MQLSRARSRYDFIFCVALPGKKQQTETAARSASKAPDSTALAKTVKNRMAPRLLSYARSQTTRGEPVQDTFLAREMHTSSTMGASLSLQNGTEHVTLSRSNIIYALCGFRSRIIFIKIILVYKEHRQKELLFYNRPHNIICYILDSCCDY